MSMACVYKSSDAYFYNTRFPLPIQHYPEIDSYVLISTKACMWESGIVPAPQNEWEKPIDRTIIRLERARAKD